MEAGIVGLPNVGKSTLFNALTAAGIPSENYPFCTIEPNVGVVPVPDDRLARIQTHIPTQKVIPAILRLVDIAGLVRGASEVPKSNAIRYGCCRATPASTPSTKKSTRSTCAASVVTSRAIGPSACALSSGETNVTAPRAADAMKNVMTKSLRTPSRTGLLS